MLCLVSPTTALLVRCAIGHVVYSTSNAAVLLALSTAAIAALSLALDPDRHEAPTNALLRRAPELLALVLLVGHAAHAAALLHWADAMGEAAVSSQYVWSHGDQSFTSLTHSHLGKSGLARLARAVGLASEPGAATASGPDSGLASALSAYDVGEPLAALVPAPLAFAMGGTTVLAFVLLLVGLPAMRARAGNEPRRWIAYLAGGLSCAQLVADGGPLSLRFAPSALLFVLALSGPSAIERGATRLDWAQGCARRLPLGLAGVAVHVALWCRLCDQDAVAGLAAAAPQWVLYALILGPRALRLDDPRRAIPRRAVAIAGAAILALGLARDASHDVVPLLRPLAEGDRVVCVDLARLTPDAHCPKGAGRTPLAIFDERGDPWKPVDVFIVRGRGESANAEHDPGKPFLLIFEPEAGASGAFQGGSLFRIASVHASRLALPSWIVAITRIEGDDGQRGLDLPLLPAIGLEGDDVVDRQNRHVWMRVLDAALRQSGVEEYVVLPLSDPPHPS